RPAGRAVGGGLHLAARPPGGSPDGDHAAGQAAECGDGAGAREYVGRLLVEGQPPLEKAPWRINLDAQEVEPSRAKGSLVSKHRGRPLRSSPQTAENQEDGDANLKAINLSRCHPSFPLGASALTRDQHGQDRAPLLMGKRSEKREGEGCRG